MDSSAGKHSSRDTTTKQFIELTAEFPETLSNKQT